jgi:hypothetical protein
MEVRAEIDRGNGSEQWEAALHNGISIGWMLVRRRMPTRCYKSRCAAVHAAGSQRGAGDDDEAVLQRHGRRVMRRCSDDEQALMRSNGGIFLESVVKG